MGIDVGEPPSIEDYTLRDLLDANDLVRELNRAEDHELGPRVIQVVCDERLIAALYVAQHYGTSAPENPEDIVVVNGKGLFLFDIPECEETE